MPARSRRTAHTTGDERERAILETAERLLADRPLKDISVDDLARGAGISRPTFYFYFASKDAVALSLFESFLGKIRDAILVAEESVGGGAKMFPLTIAATHRVLTRH